jgi:outer membrane protein
MKKVGLLNKATVVVAAVAAVLTAMPATQAYAQTSSTIFPDGWDKSIRERMFMRLGYVKGFVRTHSSDAYDVTGPVVPISYFQSADPNDPYGASPLQLWGEARSSGSSGCSAPPVSAYDDCDSGGSYGLGSSITSALHTAGMDAGLGTPKGIKSKVGDVGTLAVSLGYWLTDDFSWSLEAFVLAAPLTVNAYGSAPYVAGKKFGTIVIPGHENGLNGKKLITTKMLPPMVILARHFGSPSTLVRPYVGVGAMYAVMFDTKVEKALSDYVGGETTAHINNAFGVGPFVGLTTKLSDKYGINLSVGQVKLRTSATMTTRNTNITYDSAVLQDYPATIQGLIKKGDDSFYGPLPGKLTEAVLAYVTEQNGGVNQGTFVRKQDQVLTNTIVNLSVGMSF